MLQSNFTTRGLTYKIKVSNLETTLLETTYWWQKLLSNAGNTFRIKWRCRQGVARIVSDPIFEIEDLLFYTPTPSNAKRLKFYADSKLDVTENILDTIFHSNTHYHTVEDLLDLRYSDVLELDEVQVRRRGFDNEDPTWEPFENMQ